MTARAVCPVCARRYAGLVADTCVVCRGIGVLSLGAAALHSFDAAPVARAVTLYLEHHAQHAANTLDPADRPGYLEATVDELRALGILSADTGTPSRVQPPTTAQARDVAEQQAHQYAAHLGTTPTRDVLTRLTAPRKPLHTGRHRDAAPTLSATGDPTALATTLDPIDPIGPDTTVLVARMRTHEHDARVLATAARKAHPA